MIKAYTTSASIVVFRSIPDVAVRLVEDLSEQCDQVWVIDNTPQPVLANGDDKFASLRNVHYLPHGRNVGYGAGHNIALRMVSDRSHHIHLVVNPDVEIEAETVNTLVAYFDDPQVGLVMPRIVYPDGATQQLARRVPRPRDVARRIVKPYFNLPDGSYELADADWDYDQRVPVVSGCFMALRGSTLKQVGQFDDRFFMYFEDYDLSRRFAARSIVLSTHSPRVVHHHGRESRSSHKMARTHLKSAWQYFRKWGWFVDLERGRLNASIGPYLSRNSNGSRTK